LTIDRKALQRPSGEQRYTIGRRRRNIRLAAAKSQPPASEEFAVPVSWLSRCACGPPVLHLATGTDCGVVETRFVPMANAMAPMFFQGPVYGREPPQRVARRDYRREHGGFGAGEKHIDRLICGWGVLVRQDYRACFVTEES
jgi:hypothetical protein